MSDDKEKGTPQENTWKMPDPVFRSSQGKGPKPVLTDQEDVPTEPGFSEMQTEEDLAIPDGPQSVRPSTKVRVRTKKKGGCARTFLTIIGLIAVLAIALVSALIYFLFYYRPTDTATF